jgi:MFS family permease
MGGTRTRDPGLPLLLAAGALFGGFGIPIYSLCLAVANDDLPAGRLLGTARGLLLLNGIGTAAGPLIGGVVMDLVGPGGLFLYAAALLTALAVLAGARRRIRIIIESVVERFSEIACDLGLRLLVVLYRLAPIEARGGNVIEIVVSSAV